jgi:hypothetical protein
MRRLIALVTVSVGAAIAACGGEPTTAPAGKDNVSGDWAFNAPRLSEPTWPGYCYLTGLLIGLTRADTVLTGITSGSTFGCAGGPGMASSSNFPSFRIENGRAHGDSVEFDVGIPDIHNVGVVRGDTMSGVTMYLIHILPRNLLFTGPFVAVRRR